MKDTFSKIDLGKYSIFAVLILLFIASSFLSPNFLGSDNIINIIRQVTVTTILAYGAMMLIISGHIDLSAGSVIALTGVMGTVVYKGIAPQAGPVVALSVAVLVGIAIGVAINLLSAVMVANFAVPAFIATLAMSMVARGTVLLYTGGQNVTQLGEFTWLGQGQLGFLPIPVIALVLITLVVAYFMTQTKYGRSLYAMGGNDLAARASGISLEKSKYKVFIFNGILVGFAGVLFMSRLNSGQPGAAVGYEMEGITSAIVGGTSFTGGIGTTLGTLAGSLIIGLLNNIMTLTGVQSYIQQIVKGVIIAVAVMWDIRSKQGRKVRVILKEGSTPPPPPTAPVESWR